MSNRLFIVNTSTINQIFSKLSKANPAPQSDLQYINHYTLLVAVVLSAQSTDAQVNKATKDLFAKYNTPEKILKLGLQGIIPYVKSIGLFNSKAKNVISLSQILVEKHNSKVPENFDMLCELPGVGRKTANVVMSVAFGHTTIAVDTHVYRLSRRLNLSLGETHDAVEKDLMQIVPEQYKKTAHHLLILHGRYTCKARNPECETCVISKECIHFLNVNYGKIKGWKKHKKMTCNLIVPLGSVKFVILNDKKKLMKKIVIGENNYCRLTIPNNHWFAFKGLSKNKNIFLNISNIPHVKDEVEEIIDKRLLHLYF